MVRTLYFGLLILPVVALLAFASGAAPDANADSEPGLVVEPMVWQFDQDYPSGMFADETIPVRTVYLKTHDGTDWMSTYDPTGKAISGPDALRAAIAEYRSQGIEVAAWFVPMGTDYDQQVEMAKLVIDAGVTALYADVEPFDGFCLHECQALADNVWTRVRQERPDARLGVIYMPIEPWPAESGLATWLANADVAMPMCYWDDFEGIPPWDSPSGCLKQGKAEVDALLPGNTLEYLPVLQGNSTGEKFVEAMKAAEELGATRVSVWRRATVNYEVWDAIAGYEGLAGPRCFEALADDCLVREVMQDHVYIIKSGAKLHVPNLKALNDVGLSSADIQLVPTGALSSVPNSPPDGTLLMDHGLTYVVYGGARFLVRNAFEFSQLGLDPAAAQVVPRGATNELAQAPADGTLLREAREDTDYIVMNGGYVAIDADVASGLASAAGAVRYTLPGNAVTDMPKAELLMGDINCDGAVTIADGIAVRNASKGLSAGICAMAVGDANCDGTVDERDALPIVRFAVGVKPSPAPVGCRKLGEIDAVQPQMMRSSRVVPVSPY